MKKKKKLIWQLYPSYLLITLVSLVAVTWYATNSLRNLLLDQIAVDLEAQAHLLKRHFTAYLNPIAPEAIDALCKDVGSLSAARVTIILPDGNVVGDSQLTPEGMGNLALREEFSQALRGNTGMAIDADDIGINQSMYVAIPLLDDDRIVAVLRTSLSIASVDDTLKAIQIKIALGGLFIAVLAAGVSLVIARRISRLIETIKQGAERFSSGDLRHRLPLPDSSEMAGLAEALNQMAGQLGDRIETIIRQRNELGAVLSSMLEGVVAIDQDERIISVNQAAARMFDKEPEQITGRNIQEVIRNLALLRFVTRALTSLETIQEDIILYRKGERILNIHSTPLQDAHNRQIGTLLVINDVTQLRHLENVRQDFVANVSHEIKTPLTAIKGFVETLHQGGPPGEKEQQRFLGIILKHVNRLDAIIDDLLVLSRIEQDGDQNEIQLQLNRIDHIIRAAVQVCQPNAYAKGIDITFDCDPALRANVDSGLLEQALVNLIDNAVKYSGNDSKVKISAGINHTEMFINIQDQGPGIPRKHIPRLFERFYRVDKARSRQLGGTGLGLAIVKHIVQVHGGQIAVQSTLGRGCTFMIHLPVNEPDL